MRRFAVSVDGASRAIVVALGCIASSSALAADVQLTCKAIPQFQYIFNGQSSPAIGVQPQLSAIPKGSASWEDASPFGVGKLAKYSYDIPSLQNLTVGAYMGIPTQKVTVRIVAGNFYDTISQSYEIISANVLHTSQFSETASRVPIGTKHSATVENANKALTSTTASTSYTLVISESGTGTSVFGTTQSFDAYSYVCKLPVPYAYPL